ncbi:MAG: FlgD immunoglobulin-like domain containing protein [Chloroflexota bacterium]
MRKTAIAIALVLVATLGILVPSVAAATGDPKVVIIVGATHSVTDSYRADGDRAYVEAKKYTPNVVKVYSPNATWAKVKAAVTGASVVIYMGHGNGWPSPYTYDPNYTTKDGMGLNATAGNGDYNNKYYGEPYMAQLPLAPGAIVLLHHLCYASGNSEPGGAAPSVSVARQRADNYATGFLKAGASAVIADGHSSAASYLRPIFTTHQSVEDMWRSMPNNHGNVVSFPSARTSGALIYQDPDSPTSGFYRSLAVGAAGATTDEIVSAGYGDTGIDPTSLVVPGNATVSTDGATLFSGLDTAADAGTSLPAGTRLRVVQQPTQVFAEGGTLVEVEGIDDSSITGYMLASDLAARDSTPPVVRLLDPGGPFSPNDDSSRDSASIRGRFTESVAWKLRIRNSGGTTVYETTGTGSSFTQPWDGKVGGNRVPDGAYSVTLTGDDAWANGDATATRQLVVDTRPPALASLSPSATTNLWFSPNGDGVRDAVSLTATNAETGALVTRVVDAGDALVKTWTTPNGSASQAITWNGKTSTGAVAADGIYTIKVAPRDRAGNTGAFVDRTVKLVAALRSVTTSRTLFFPQDLDSLDRSTTLRFTLSRPMTVDWKIVDAAGHVVATKLDDAALAAGTQSWVFNGVGTDGLMVPRGRYTSVVTATDGTLLATQAIGFEMEAFRYKLSDATPGRGQKITVTVTSAEVLNKISRLSIYQPGLDRWRVTLTKVSNHTYKVTFRLKSAGKSGIVKFKVSGRDTRDGSQSTTVSFPIH